MDAGGAGGVAKALRAPGVIRLHVAHDMVARAILLAVDALHDFIGHKICSLKCRFEGGRTFLAAKGLRVFEKIPFKPLRLTAAPHADRLMQAALLAALMQHNFVTRTGVVPRHEIRSLTGPT
jgi:hypothetical protein